METKVCVAPSILSAHPMRMGEDIGKVLCLGADLLHVDIMDAHFVPNLTYGPGVVKGIREVFPNAYQDVHLMMTDPGRYVADFLKAGADEITVHVEIAGDKTAVIDQVHQAGKRVGLSVKPATPVSALTPYLNKVDLILVMTVEPGFGGQKMMPECVQKVAELRQMGFDKTISVDGGVTRDNAPMVVAAGADRLVMGTAVFGAQDPKAVMDAVKGLAHGR